MTLNIKLIGCGGAGSNTIAAIAPLLPTASSLILDLDAMSLSKHHVPHKLLVGKAITRGLSSGGNLDIAKKAFDDAKEDLIPLLENVDLIVIVGALAGGTGAVFTACLAELARSKGAMVIAFPIMPFSVEGSEKQQRSIRALEKVRKSASATIPIPNDLLIQGSDLQFTILDAFNIANDWILKALTSIIDSISLPGIINLDLSLLKNVFGDSSGQTLFSIATAEGPNYVEKALDAIVACPLLHTPYVGQNASHLLINIKGGANLSIHHVNQITSFLAQFFKSQDNNTIGAVLDDTWQNKVQITVFGVSETKRKATKKRYVFAEEGELEQQDLFNEPAQKVTENSNPLPTPAGSSSAIDSVAQSRGYFASMDRYLINGIDLDVPTYLRKGIKIGA